jgi:hypothetical protein
VAGVKMAVIVRDDVIPTELTTEADTVVLNIIDNVLPVSYKDLPAGDRMRQPRAAQDLNGFYGLVKQALDDKILDDNVSAENTPIFTEESPSVGLQTETITYRLIKRIPATLGGPPFRGARQEFKSHIRSIEDDENNPNFKMFTLGQQFENEVTFTCWAKTNKQANIRVMWFEDLMRDYAWFLKYNGFMECFFMRRLEDVSIDITGDGNILHARPLVYYVRTERLSHLSKPTIRRVIINCNIDADNQ